MAEELTKEEVERRARELAQRVMSKPYQKQEWPKKAKDHRSRSSASSEQKPRSTDEAS